MAQSVKLKDGSYIDTEGIYDVTQGKTQAALNKQVQNTYVKTIENWTTVEHTYTITFDVHAVGLLMFDLNGSLNVYVFTHAVLQALYENYSAYAPTSVKTTYGMNITFSLPAWSMATCIAGRGYDVVQNS